MHLPRCLQFNKNTNANTSSSTKANAQHIDTSSDATLMSGNRNEKKLRPIFRSQEEAEDYNPGDLCFGSCCRKG